jgi:hypothetical protein
MVILPFSAFKKYDVALSFAEEDRGSVDIVAKLLKEHRIKVFYDDDLRIDSWGKYLKHYLDRAYRLQAKYCVVFVSKDYQRKRWTNFELGRAQARSFFQKNEAYILPYLLDESEFTKEFLDVGCLKHQTHDEDKLAKAIIDKLNKRLERRFIIWLKDLYRIKRRLITAIILILGGGTFLLKDKLTPVNALAERIYESAGHEVSGSVCKDSTFSYKQGQGACSHHGGVWYKVDTIIHDKTTEQSKKEAKKTSLFGP